MSKRPDKHVPPPYAPWHFLYFFPLPHGHGSLRPVFCPVTTGVALRESSPPMNCNASISRSFLRWMLRVKSSIVDFAACRCASLGSGRGASSSLSSSSSSSAIHGRKPLGGPDRHLPRHQPTLERTHLLVSRSEEHTSELQSL